jgi:hypothetical protein
MDSFFGWTATAVAAYLTGCDLFEAALPTNDGTHVPAQGTPVCRLICSDNDPTANLASVGARGWFFHFPNPRQDFRAGYLLGPRFPTFAGRIPRYYHPPPFLTSPVLS